MSGEFADHFSGCSGDYAKHRPTYPSDFIAAVVAYAEGRDLVWDAGAGNGQASVLLAEHFARVVATDPSAAQIARAQAHPRIAYAVAAESCELLADGSVDLVTVAQAYHWFDVARFAAEVRRVAKPGARVAVWTYLLLEVEPAIDRVVRRFYTERVGRYWPPERRHVESGYRDIAFPFADAETRRFEMAVTMRRDDLIAYIATWSAVERCRKHESADPIPALCSALEEVWPEPFLVHKVRWPLILRVGRI